MPLTRVSYVVKKYHANSTVARFQYSPQEVLTRRAHAESQERQATNNAVPRDIFDKLVKDL